MEEANKDEDVKAQALSLCANVLMDTRLQISKSRSFHIIHATKIISSEFILF